MALKELGSSAYQSSRSMRRLRTFPSPRPSMASSSISTRVVSLRLSRGQQHEQQIRLASTVSSPRSTKVTSSAAATVAQQDLHDLEQHSALTPGGASTPGSASAETAKNVAEFDPVALSRQRGKKKLPRARYQYRPPNYYRGPLHPHQPPRPSDPASREFIPGPFTLPRLQQTFTSTLAPDIMTLAYRHVPPGYTTPPAAPRLRSWIGDSPYFKNRPLRAPRGTDRLGLVTRPITFRNVPQLTGITVHSFVPKRATMQSSAPMHVAFMAIQAITGHKGTVSRIRHPVPQWGTTKGLAASLRVTLKDEDAFHFLAKVVDVVMPKIRDYAGVSGTSGDDNGNISFGLTPEMLAFFPEIEINYDSYPPDMVPGCHITMHTSATNDRDARLLLSAMGVPFYGKFIN